MTTYTLVCETTLGDEGRDATVELVYSTHGEPSPSRDNCIVLPTYYTGTHASYDAWVGPGKVFDTDRWFVVIPNLIGNGYSAARDPGTGQTWAPHTHPVVRVVDNVHAQRLLLDHLDVERIALVAGWSMGGLQAYQWAATYPSYVDAVLPICAASRCWEFNWAFLEGMATYLEWAVAGRVDRRSALAAFGRSYATWAYSAEYFRHEVWRTEGVDSVEQMLQSWEADHQSHAPENLLAVLRTWQRAGLGTSASAALTALAGIEARVIAMPCATDTYFRLSENEIEVAEMSRAELRPIVSAHGHVAGRPGLLPEVTMQVAGAVRDLLTGGT